MFRRSVDEEWMQRLDLVENTLGINLPRVATLEYQMKDVFKKIGMLESRSDRDIQRRMLTSEASESMTAQQAEGAPIWTEGEPRALPPAAPAQVASQGPAPSPAPALQDSQPLDIVSFTATEHKYGSGAQPGLQL